MRLQDEDGRQTSLVPLTTLPRLLNTTRLGFKIDFLSIDVEGAEMSILSTIDFDLYDIGLLSIENDYNDPKYCEFLRPRGYICAGRIGFLDELFIKRR